MQKRYWPTVLQKRSVKSQKTLAWRYCVDILTYNVRDWGDIWTGYEVGEEVNHHQSTFCCLEHVKQWDGSAFLPARRYIVLHLSNIDWWTYHFFEKQVRYVSCRVAEGLSRGVGEYHRCSTPLYGVQRGLDREHTGKQGVQRGLDREHTSKQGVQRGLDREQLVNIPKAALLSMEHVT